VIKQITLIMAVIFTLVIINNPAFGITPLERAVINDERLVNLSGATLGEHIIVNQQVQITAKITNTQEENQDFVYIVQIKNENDIVVKLGWISGSLTKHQSFSPSLSWTPKESGVYTAEIFVWNSLLHQGALTNNITLEIITS
jgi:hypothetical protein